MSIIAALFGWTKLPAWVQELIAVAILAAGAWGGVAIWHHKAVVEGITEQKQADDKASSILIAKAAQETAALQVKATQAEHSHDQEIADLQAYRTAHPDADGVRLCIDTHKGDPSVRQSSAANPGDAGASAATGNVQQVSAGNHSGGEGTAGPDIFPMLDLLANKADIVSAALREFQNR